jgi:hypothetical protein
MILTRHGGLPLLHRRRGHIEEARKDRLAHLRLLGPYLGDTLGRVGRGRRRQRLDAADVSR